jgi:tetratricopeptide (TPR) repeat protein
MSSEEIRKEGNDLYKVGKIDQAIGCYTQAASLAPSASEPWSNLSAAHFELGDYQACIGNCDGALELL